MPLLILLDIMYPKPSIHEGVVCILVCTVVYMKSGTEIEKQMTEKQAGNFSSCHETLYKANGLGWGRHKYS